MPKKVYQLGANDEVALASDIQGGGGGGGGGGSGVAIIELYFNYQGSQGVTVGGNTYRSHPSLPNYYDHSVIPVTPGETITYDFDGYQSDAKIALNGVGNASPPSTLAAGDSLYIMFGSCLSPDTAIIMADGSSKRLDAVREGDTVLTPLGPDRVSAVSSGTGKATDIWTFSDGTVIKTIGRHRFFDCDLGEMLYLEAWNLGEHALRADYAKVELVSHERIEGEAPHATLFTEKWNMYYANGLLAGNRKSRGLDKIAWPKNP